MCPHAPSVTFGDSSLPEGAIDVWNAPDYTISCVKNITHQYILILPWAGGIMEEHRPRGGNRKHREERGLCTK